MKKLHMIGNAHLDPVWLWRWQEGFQENKATFLAMANLLDEYEGVMFTSSSAQFYQWVERNAPALFERVKKHIQEGRWVLCGGWWVQPDCNIPCGESFARHALIAQNYFQEKFGITAQVGYNVDSFGHNGMLPQLLRLSGMDKYVFMRPGPHEKELPGRNFIWESQDGSRVTAFRIPYTYCAFADLEKHIRTCAEEIDQDSGMMMCFYGVGNHGGGPTRSNIDTIRALEGKLEDTELIFSDPNRYFVDLAKSCAELPVVQGDLLHHASGCYSAHSGIKRMNRRAEHALLRTERFSSLAKMLGKSAYPDALDEAWKLVLFNQFHDILAGTSIKSACDDAVHQLSEAVSIADREETYATQALSFAVNIPRREGALPVVAFNPHAWPVDAHVEVESGGFNNPNQLKTLNLRVLDSGGEALSWQSIAPEATLKNSVRLVFPARVPAMGYATFHIVPNESAADARAQHGPRALEPGVLENEQVRLQFDIGSGGLASFVHKATGAELAGGALAEAVVIEDRSDTWSHGVTRFDKVIGRFEAVSVKTVESGPVRSSVRVTSRHGWSTLVQTFTLYEGSADVHVKAKVNWQEQFKCLKLRFPLALKESEFTREIPYGIAVNGANGEEQPIQRWMDISGRAPNGAQAGLCVVNDSKYSASATGSAMDLMVLRSPVYCHHDPLVLPEDTSGYEFMDQGPQSFTYILAPHAGGWRKAQAVRKAWQLNMPLLVTQETYHEGSLPQSVQGIEVSADNVVVSALKQALDGDGYVLRIHECEGESADARIRLPLIGCGLTAVLKPWEIKTFRIRQAGIAGDASWAEETNLLEWPMEMPGSEK